MGLLVIFALALFGFKPADGSTLECFIALSQISENPATFSEAYLNLFRALVQNKNALSVEDLKIILSQPTLVNPFDIVTPSLSSDQTFAFRQAFNKVMERNKREALDWDQIKSKIENLVSEKSRGEVVRLETKENTKDLLLPKALSEISAPYPNEKIAENPTYFTDQGDQYISYLGDNGRKVVLLNLRTKVSKVVPIKSSSVIPTIFNWKGQTYISSFIHKTGKLKLFDTAGNDRTTDVIPERIFKGNLATGAVAIAERGDKLNIVKIDDRHPFGGLVSFIPVDEQGAKVKSVEENRLAGGELLPQTFNFKDRSVVGFHGEDDTFLVYDSFTGDIILEKKVTGAEGPMEFYEIAGEPRVLLITRTGAVILNPFTGDILGRFRFKKSHESPRNIVLYEDQGRKFAVVPESDLGRKALLIDLQENRSLGVISLTPEKETLLSTNISSFTLRGRPLLIWGTQPEYTKQGDGEILVFDPLSKKIIFRATQSELRQKISKTTVYDDVIKFIAPYTLNGNVHAIVALKDEALFEMQLTEIPGTGVGR